MSSGPRDTAGTARRPRDVMPGAAAGLLPGDVRRRCRDQRPCVPDGRGGCTAGMFVGDEMQVQVSAVAAAARLASLIRGSSLSRASRAAWDEGIARVGPAGPVPGLSKLVRVQVLPPVQRGAATVLALRWEATGPRRHHHPAPGRGAGHAARAGGGLPAASGGRRSVAGPDDPAPGRGRDHSLPPALHRRRDHRSHPRPQR